MVTVRAQPRPSWRARLFAPLALCWVAGVSVLGCQGGEVQTGAIPVTTGVGVPGGSVSTPLKPQPTCLADSDCSDIATAPCAHALCNPTTKRCEAGSLPDFTVCAGGGLCAEEAACLSGVCVATRARDCDDDNPCTADDCSLEEGCLHSPKTLAPCTDGNPCTVDDRCVGGACVALNNICACKADADCAGQANACLGTLICADAACVVDSATAVDCDDGNPCTQDVCAPATGACSHPPVQDSTPCQDDDVCTLAERCQQGACVGAAVLPCAANDDACPTSSCDPVLGCVAGPASEGLACDDGNACTQDDACKQGVCAGTSTCGCTSDLDCADRAKVPACLGQVVCRAGRCETDPNVAVPCPDSGQACVLNLCTAEGCKLTTAPTNAPCDDGTLCTWGDNCEPGGTCQSGDAPNCDDGLPCTNDACVPSTGCIHGPGSDGQGCDDGSSCTTGDTCKDQQCVGAHTGCDDNDPCTTDFCAPGGAGCIHQQLTQGASCDDGDPCTTGDRCNDNFCEPLNVQDCDDGNVCTQDLCDGADGCAHPAVTAALACDDGDSCTTADVCAEGVCAGKDGACECKTASDCAGFEDGNLCNGVLVCQNNSCIVDLATVVTCTDSVSPCVQVACQPATGLCTESAAKIGADCDDGNACTQAEACIAGGACGGGQGVVCDDGDLCTTDTCVPSSGCVATAAASSAGLPCDDGNPCTQGDVCDIAGCKAGPNTCQCKVDADCGAFDDGNLCNGGLRCEAGACVPDGKAPTCDASTAGPCEDVVCVPTTGTCTTTTRDDGSACKVGIGCGKPGTCQTGTCVVGSGKVCDDANPCTTDSCGAGNTCQNVPQGGQACDDGDSCTTGEVCDLSGSCGGGTNTCACKLDIDCADDGDACNGTPVCLGGTCQTKPGSVVTCSTLGDGPCKATACEPKSGTCQTTNAADGGACEDGDACTQGTVCGSGTCGGGTALVCDDGNVCTDDACNPATGCVNTQHNKACDDGNPCTTGDLCAAGTCQAGANTCECQVDADCAAKDDGNACNGKVVCKSNTCQTDPASVVTCDPSGNTSCAASVCEPTTGVCKVTAFPEGTTCSDGSVCTAKDSCSKGVCVGAAVSCDDGNPCSDDTCDPLAGCKNVANAAVCDDGNPCTAGDQCQNGACQPGQDTCGGCSTDADCAKQDDGDLCNGTLTCQSGSCEPTGAVTCVDDGNPCTSVACQPGSGQCLTLTLGNGAACDDGDACTPSSACLSGQCVGSGTVNCDDDNACTLDTCSKAAGCLNQAAIGTVCDDGNSCTAPDLCGPSGTCVGGVNSCECKADGDCAGKEDGDVCNGTLSCQAGKCAIKPGSVVVCDPAQNTPCRTNACSASTGTCALTSQPEGAACDDGNVCTTGDGCAKGACTGKPVDCDDGTPCTFDVCDSKAGCTQVNQDGVLCDDGNACTGDDVCKAGACVGGSNSCDCKTSADCASKEDGDLCNGTLVCVANQCVVDAKSVVVCEAPGACAVNVCAPKTGVCVSGPAADGSPCGGDVLCGGTGACAKGVCEGPSGCADDGNPCTEVKCNGEGGCESQDVVVPCDDGDSCTVGDTCQAGLCAPGNDECECKVDSDCKGFDDGDLCNGVWSCGAGGKCAFNAGSVVVCAPSSDPCTLSACAPSTGLCATKALPNGAACVDQDACTSQERCFGGTCLKQPVACDDGNPCTADACDADAGCVSTPVGGIQTCDDGDPCTPFSLCQNGSCNGPINTCFCQTDADCTDDGDLCNGKPTCQGGSCNVAPGSVVVCDTSSDGACEATQCVPVTGQCLKLPKSPGTGCDDGSLCTASDVCAGSTCVGIPISCADGIVCTTEACDPKVGCVSAADDAACDDDDPCTDDVCDPVSGCVAKASEGKACDDSDPCTSGERCLVGAQGVSCTGGVPTSCDDGDPCTDDTCDADAGCDNEGGTGAPCDDGDGCTTGDACGVTGCAGTAKVCDDGNPCTADACSPTSGTCVAVAAPGACDDGDPCTLGDTCAGGACKGTGGLPCDDNNPCTADTCVAGKGCASTPTANGGACDDGNPCSTGETCAGGTCGGGVAKGCNDGNPCTVDDCDATTGACSNKPDAGGLCDDGDPCTGGGACDGAGVCQAEPVVCDDANACTDDACVAGKGCASVANTASCDDGDPCTQGDACKGGTCVAGPKAQPCCDKDADCDDSDPCTADSCVDGTCKNSALPAGSCDDGNPCTATQCKAGEGCQSKPIAGDCDDGNACTSGDTCSAGACTGSVAVVCNDGNPCTDDACAPGQGCVTKPNTAPCDDGEPCTGQDTCSNGACAGASLSCDDGNACTTDTCVKGKGCSNAPLNNTPCNDGDSCTLLDRCVSGKCEPQFTVSCDDSNVCTTDTCGLTGCVNTNNAASCDDGNACTGPDACSGGKCSGGQTPCDDGNVCTTDFCDQGKGCGAVANSNACSDNSQCTTGDVCSGGACKGKPVDCDDQNPCTQDVCLANAGCQNSALADGAACGTSGVCLSGTCSAGSDVNPALSCKDVRDKVPGAKSGAYFVDPDGAGPGSSYQVLCDMDRFGGGWMVLNVAQVNALMTMQSLVLGGGCALSSTEWKTWDGFDGATADNHFCVAEPKVGLNWPTYQEIRIDGVQLVGYTPGGGNTFDAYSNCYGASWQGNFCVGPSLELKPVNTADIQLSNGQSSPEYNASFTLSQPRDEFQVRTREEGPQDEGIRWTSGAILLR